MKETEKDWPLGKEGSLGNVLSGKPRAQMGEWSIMWNSTERSSETEVAVGSYRVENIGDLDQTRRLGGMGGIESWNGGGGVVPARMRRKRTQRW